MSSSGERTEKATPKRREDERKKGNILQARDFTVAIQMMAIVLIFQLGRGWMGTMLRGLMTTRLTVAEKNLTQLTIEQVMLDFRQVLMYGLLVLAPVMAGTLLVTVVVETLKSRFLFTGKTLAIKGDRINPISGLKKMFSWRSVTEMVKSIVKIAVLILVVNKPFRDILTQAVNLSTVSVTQGVTVIGARLVDIAIKCALAIFVFSIVDLVYQWWRYEKDMRMTKQEVKDEQKEMDGDPQTRGRIRSIQRQMAMQRMMQQVPEADVVIMNPTHYAVCLRYQINKDPAPMVVAKGKDLIALRIREIAREHKVEIVEDKSLARSLFAACEIGSLIPVELYQAVAQVLVNIAKIKEGYYEKK